jgi:hypothetical protein
MKSVYRNVGAEDKGDTKKNDKVLPVIKVPPKRIQFLNNAAQARANGSHVILNQSNGTKNTNESQTSNPNPKNQLQPKIDQQR